MNQEQIEKLWTWVGWKQANQGKSDYWYPPGEKQGRLLPKKVTWEICEKWFVPLLETKKHLRIDRYYNRKANWTVSFDNDMFFGDTMVETFLQGLEKLIDSEVKI